MKELPENKKINLLNNEYFKNTKYIVFGMALMLTGIINFVIGYMYFIELSARNLSISTLVVILGLCMVMVYENRINKIKKALIK